MRRKGRHLNKFRKKHPLYGKTPPDTLYGYFVIPVGPEYLNVISSGSQGGEEPECQWEHVSVSLPHRCPTWGEMHEIKRLFWDDHETVVQFHPKKTSYVNQHEFCLHMWKRRGVNAELPPIYAV